MAEHQAFPEAGACSKYDLFGVVNHFGILNGGHYTATIKNQSTGEWLEYNDSVCKPILEQDVRTAAAYMLFYRRKDTFGKDIT